MKNTNVSIKEVYPDVDQPRKFFDVSKLSSLKKSIKEHGIMNPLSVEQTPEGYLLVDGERRYRAAKELGIKEVPIVILDSTDATSRTIEQFHIQEMHEGWTPMEKAAVIGRLVEDLKKPFSEVCRILNIPETSGRMYASLNKLVAKEAFNSNDIGANFAEPIVSVTTYAKQISRDALDTNFTLTDQKNLQKVIIKNIAEGVIATSRDVTRLKDTFKADPKSIEKFIGGSNPEELFVKSKARSAYHLRQIYNSTISVPTHIKGYMTNPDVKPSEEDKTHIGYLYNHIKKLMDFMGIDE